MTTAPPLLKIVIKYNQHGIGIESQNVVKVNFARTIFCFHGPCKPSIKNNTIADLCKV